MLQQPLARRVAGAARCAAAGEALPGALPLSSMRRRARGLRAAAVPTDGTTESDAVRCLDGPARGPDGARLRYIYQSGDYDSTVLSVQLRRPDPPERHERVRV